MGWTYINKGALLGVAAENSAVFAIELCSVNNILLRTALAPGRLFGGLRFLHRRRRAQRRTELALARDGTRLRPHRRAHQDLGRGRQRLLTGILLLQICLRGELERVTHSASFIVAHYLFVEIKYLT
jgi:hypothetical protein